MNIGSEEAKGTGMIKQVRDILRTVPDLNYIGYVEGREHANFAAPLGDAEDVADDGARR